MAKQPNILLITTDQQHYDTLGVANPRIRTPSLDRLAEEGVRFDRAYCCNPVCSPSRSSIITGLYPAWHGCWTIGVKLPEDVPTVGDEFQRHGYESILVGKAHFQPLASAPGSESIECQPILRDLDFWREFHGPWYGFNHVETARMHGHESHAGQHYALWLEEKGLANWKDYFQQWPPSDGDKYNGPHYLKDALTWDLPEELHHTHWVGERTVKNIEACANDGKPFFLWSSFFDPHPPYVIPEPWASMYDPADMPIGHLVEGEHDDMPPQFAKTQEESPDFSEYLEEGGNGLHGFHSHLHNEAELRRSMAYYYGMMSLIDQEVGRILDALDRLGIADNTLVLFTTDHGHFLGQHGLIAKGAFHYEDLLRIPMIARFPGRVPAGRVSSTLQTQIDFAPTFLDAAGIDVPGLMQGYSQLPVWSGEKPEVAREHVLVENRHNPTTVHLRTYVDQRYKLTVYRDKEYGELFDLKEDPRELHNRWNDPQYASVKSKLMHRFLQAEIQREPTRMPRIAGA
ncbi:MAG: sulfatase-like hydrolase/transferase [Candidatus Pacebacteria bacterium]|nr:sulfatase-like hydrolase/transferase [Candidatus Paceibacterota bacterium]